LLCRPKLESESDATAPLLKQYFLPSAMTFVPVLSVPCAGATVVPDLLPTGVGYLSDVLPLKHGLKFTRGEASCGGADILASTPILSEWAAIALILLGVAGHRDAERRMAHALAPVFANGFSSLLRVLAGMSRSRPPQNGFRLAVGSAAAVSTRA
jgi:hypothetical protein